MQWDHGPDYNSQNFLAKLKIIVNRFAHPHLKISAGFISFFNIKYSNL